MKLRKYILPRTIQDFASLAFALAMIPLEYWFFVFIVLPNIYPVMTLWYIIHLIISTIFMINITSNFVYVIMQDCSILGEVMPSMKPSPDWNFCDICETVTPPRSFHCSVCGICILKRDHHCQFAGCCIGHQNLRFFMSFLLYLSIASVYAMYFYTLFLVQRQTFDIYSFVKFLFPLVVFIIGIDVSLEHFYVIMYVLNVLIMLTAITLFVFHFKSVLQGVSMYEKNHKIQDYSTRSYKDNVKQVAGERYYLAWLSPFIDSKLPNDGIYWVKCCEKSD